VVSARVFCVGFFEPQRHKYTKAHEEFSLRLLRLLAYGVVVEDLLPDCSSAFSLLLHSDNLKANGYLLVRGDCLYKNKSYENIMIEE
jgi:hypothetical protein